VAAYGGGAVVARVGAGGASNLARQITNQRATLIRNAGGDSRLEGIIKQLFKSSDKIPGGTAGILSKEAKTGQLLSKTGHLQKAEERIKQLTRYLKNDDISNKSRQTASKLLKDLNDAVKKFKKKTQ
jgi:hypothetical protein